MNTAMAIIAWLPVVVLLLWRAVKPYMLCRDVEAGSTTKDALFYLLVEATAYMAVPFLIRLKKDLNTTFITMSAVIFLIGLSGAIRTAVAIIRIKKSSNKALQAIGAEAAPQPDR